MKYYQFKHSDFFDYRTGMSALQNELLTKAELQKYFPSMPKSFIKKISVKKSSTYFSFGARFLISESGDK